MRCGCCDAILTDYESTRKHALTGDYLDTCSSCLSEINAQVYIDTLDRPDLLGKDDSLYDTDDAQADEY